MLFSRIKDFRLRKKFLKFEHKIKIRKFVFINMMTYLKHSKQHNTFLLKAFLLNPLKNKSQFSKSKMIRYCLINKRTRSVNRPFNLSRSIFRELLQFGLVPGYKKAVW